MLLALLTVDVERVLSKQKPSLMSLTCLIARRFSALWEGVRDCSGGLNGVNSAGKTRNQSERKLPYLRFA